MKDFTGCLARAIEETGGRLCVGLDPHATLVPEALGTEPAGVEAFLAQVIEETSPHACCFKPNSAFFEAMGADGVGVLRRTVARAHDASRPVILDAKRGDIASTAAAYAAWAARVVGADALTVVAYMGEDAIRPFLDAGLFAYVLALPSNAAAAEIACHGDPPVCAKTAALGGRLAREYGGLVGLVVGATQARWVGAVHDAAPTLPWLVPGVGAQGGDVEALRSASKGHDAMIVSASRAILAASKPGAAARDLKLEIERGLR
jgi:orotidine-5'-phosphate decarboxylase